MSAEADAQDTKKIVNVNYNWKFSCSDVSKCKKNQSFIESPKFRIKSAINKDSTQWYLRLYPKGLAEIFDDHFSLALYNKWEITAAVSHFKVSTNVTKIVTKYITAEYVFKSGCGHVLSISRDFSDNEKTDEKLIIGYEINLSEAQLGGIQIEELTDKEIDDERRLKVMDKLTESLLKDESFTDVVLKSEGKSVKAHKCILTNSSPVFAAMFSVEMKEKQENVVEIEDFKYDVLVDIIRFMYTGKVDSVSIELIMAAEKYGLGDLKRVCETTLGNSLSFDNLVEYLKIADQLDMENIKNKGIDFVIEHGIEISEKIKLNLLPHDILSKVCFRLLKENEFCQSFCSY